MKTDERQADTSHVWGAAGERCVLCGDKDWMGDPVCSAKSTKPHQHQPTNDTDATGGYS